MGISKPSFSSNDREQTRNTVIRLLANKPVDGAVLPGELQLAPGTVAGYYNAQERSVELFVMSPAGNKWLRIR